MGRLPVIDVGRLRGDARDRAAAASAIDTACRQTGFFYASGHGVDPVLGATVDEEARAFFALDETEKAEIEMARGGRAWRGWFPVGGELTSGVPDAKEGLYFGAELGLDDPRVRAGLPLHGPNLFPRRPAGLRPAVLAYMAALTQLGHTLCQGLALALGLDAGWFAAHLTADPLVLFRLFRYPAGGPADGSAWGVGEHTDYGLLTILGQDTTGGLEVHTPDGWIEVPPVGDAFVCNLGDMLERMTAGRYRSTPHRVRPAPGRDRLSSALFFDPSWDAEVVPVPVAGSPMEVAGPRWDGADVHQFHGTYGEYLLGKVRKVFPDLGDAVLEKDG